MAPTGSPRTPLGIRGPDSGSGSEGSINATEATAANASRIYVDGADVTSAAVSFAGIGDVSNGSNMAIGGAVGANVYTDIISFLSTHFKAGWFAGGATNNTQWDAFVASNYALVAP